MFKNKKERKGILNSYNKKKNKSNILMWLIGEAIFIFVIATASIVLYDMYINIDVVEYDSYVSDKTAREVNTENTNDISDTLENVSKSVVRNI